MSMRKLADHIIAVAQEENLKITNLQLQKVMYFALKYAKNKKVFNDDELEELYDAPFYVWAYGPVCKEQYDRFKKFGSSPIIGNFDKDSSLDDLNSNIIEKLKENVFVLVDESHQEPFWDKNKDNIFGFRSNVPYELGDI